MFCPRWASLTTPYRHNSLTANKVPRRARRVTPDPGAAAVGEDREVPRERVLAEGVAGDPGQAVVALAEVDRGGGDEDPEGGRQADHGRAPMASRRRRRVSGSKPGATAIRRLLSRIRTSGSAGAAAGVGAVGSATSVTGRNR